jgi:hypothetical protein
MPLPSFHVVIKKGLHIRFRSLASGCPLSLDFLLSAIKDVNTFNETQDKVDPKSAQMKSMIEWNKFQRKYGFGDPFQINKFSLAV